MSASGDERAAPAADSSAAPARDEAGPGAEPGAGANGAAPGARAATSRRFPTFTRDTARPEGGGRVVGRNTPVALRQWPLLAVCSGVLIGLLVVLAEFRSGTILVGLSLIGGAVLRWTRPSVGMLAVRSRFTDMATYGVLGGAITLLAMMAQPDPLLNIPILDDIVHFSVS